MDKKKLNEIKNLNLEKSLALAQINRNMLQAQSLAGRNFSVIFQILKRDPTRVCINPVKTKKQLKC